MSAVRDLLANWRAEVTDVGGPEALRHDGPLGDRRMRAAGGRLSIELRSLAACAELLADAVGADELHASAWPDVLDAFTREQLFTLRTAVNARLDAPSSVRTRGELSASTYRELEAAWADYSTEGPTPAETARLNAAINAVLGGR